MPYLCFDVSFLKENIVAAIPLQQSETRSCHRECGSASRSKGPAQALLCKSGIARMVCNQAAININISLMWVITLQRFQWAPHRAFAAFKNTSRQCHYFASKPGMLSSAASPLSLTAFPLQIHRSLRKVKKAGPVYFGRWNIFRKSNRSAIFSFRLAEGVKRNLGSASVNSRSGRLKSREQDVRDDTGAQTTVAHSRNDRNNHVWNVLKCWGKKFQEICTAKSLKLHVEGIATLETVSQSSQRSLQLIQTSR